MSPQGYVPRSLLFQWHLTERCNLRCAHCYQDHYIRDELKFAELIDILSQFKALLAVFEHRAGHPIPAHITVTGGEPFVRQDFLALLEVLAAHRTQFSFAILTNGSFIDTQMAQYLRQLGPSFIQVSIEGGAQTHDQIRGSSNFAQTVSTIKTLRKAKLLTLIAFTAHRNNYHEFPEVARLGRTLNVNRVWADRLVPWGSGAHLQTMSPEETQDFLNLMAKTRAHNQWLRRYPEIAMHRALQFLAGGSLYHCTAGDSLLTVQPNGDLYPCRRLPIRMGNVLETPLVELYDNSTILHQLRQPERISRGCEQCSFNTTCRGGLKCLSYALTGDPFTADPGCWLANRC